jgi:hypothetical protein
MPFFCPILSIPVKAGASLNSLPRCTLCSTEFLPDKKSRKHQIYCSISCRNLAKKKRDKRHKLAYQKKEKYRLAKREQNRSYRKKKGWVEYMKRYREDHIEEAKRQNQKASKKYYQRNRRKIAFRRSEIRWEQKLRTEIEALKKISS